MFPDRRSESSRGRRQANTWESPVAATQNSARPPGRCRRRSADRLIIENREHIQRHRPQKGAFRNVPHPSKESLSTSHRLYSRLCLRFSPPRHLKVRMCLPPHGGRETQKLTRCTGSKCLVRLAEAKSIDREWAEDFSRALLFDIFVYWYDSSDYLSYNPHCALKSSSAHSLHFSVSCSSLRQWELLFLVYTMLSQVEMGGPPVAQ